MEKQYPSDKRQAELKEKIGTAKKRHMLSFERELTDKALLATVRELEADYRKDFIKAYLKPLTESDFNFLYDVVLMEAKAQEQLRAVEQEMKQSAVVTEEIEDAEKTNSGARRRGGR